MKCQKLYGIVLFILFMLIQSSALAQDIFKDDVFLSHVKNKDRVDVYVVNRTPFTITMAVEAKLENMKSSKVLPDTAVYPPHSKTRAFFVSVKKRTKGWRYSFQYSWIPGDINPQFTSTYKYHLPYRNGDAHPVLQSFDGAFSHSGYSKYALDFEMPVGTPVYSAREGTVVKVVESHTKHGPSEAYRDDSNYVVIQHADGTWAEYHHLMHNGVIVEVGQHVVENQQIAISGNTGFTTGPHLHFLVAHRISWNKASSIPVQFRSVKGTIRQPVVGVAYRAE